MQLRLIQESARSLPEYASIPIRFEVIERLVLPIEPATNGLHLRTRAVDPAYLKDYDGVPGCRPVDWAGRWDLSKWWFAVAVLGKRRVGGAAVVMEMSDVEGAAARRDVAVLWDIRVHPDHRRRGIGQRLIQFAEDQARARGKRRMKVETQDINVPACRFYAGAGFALAEIDRFAYPDLPDEIKLVWEKELR